MLVNIQNCNLPGSSAPAQRPTHLKKKGISAGKRARINISRAMSQNFRRGPAGGTPAFDFFIVKFGGLSFLGLLVFGGPFGVLFRAYATRVSRSTGAGDTRDQHHVYKAC